MAASGDSKSSTFIDMGEEDPLHDEFLQLDKKLRQIIVRKSELERLIRERDARLIFNTDSPDVSPNKLDLIYKLASEEEYTLENLLSHSIKTKTGNIIAGAPHIYESLWEFAFFCGLVPTEVPRFPVDSIIVLINPDTKETITNEYFENTPLHTRPGSKADIICKITTKEADLYKLVSVKYYSKYKNLVKHYDIADIIEEFRLDSYSSSFPEGTTDILLCIKNGTDRYSLIKNARTSGLRARIHESQILGEEQLNILLPRIRKASKLFLSKRNTSIVERPLKAFRVHQAWFAESTLQYIREQREKDTRTSIEILWGAVARSGKTMSTVGFLTYYIRRVILGGRGMAKSALLKRLPRILILTPFPTETMLQWYNDIFYVFRDVYSTELTSPGNGNLIYCSRESLCKTSPLRGRDITKVLSTNPYVMIMSTQKLRQDGNSIEAGSTDAFESSVMNAICTLDNPTNPSAPDIVIMDEAHQAYFVKDKGSLRKKSKGVPSCSDTKNEWIMDIVNKPSQICLFLTATYGKVTYLRNPKTYTWSYEDQVYFRDIARCSYDEIQSRYSDIYDGILKRFRIGEGDSAYKKTLSLLETPEKLHSEFQKAYINIPDLHVVGGYFNGIHTDSYDKTSIREGFTSGYYASMWKIYGKGFQNPKQILYLLRQICFDPKQDIFIAKEDAAGAAASASAAGSTIKETTPHIPRISQYKTAYTHIEEIQRNYGDATDVFSLQNGEIGRRKKISQLWFLPMGTSIKDDLGSSSSAGAIKIRIASLIWIMMVEHSGFWENYDILSLNHSNRNTLIRQCYESADSTEASFLEGHREGDDDCKCRKCSIHHIKSSTKSIPEAVQIAEENAHKKGKMLIILTGGRATTGVTLKNVDIVGLFNTETSHEQTFQKIFRGLTDRVNKSAGYVIDPNPQRTQKAVYDSFLFSRTHEPNPEPKTVTNQLSVLRRLCPLNSLGYELGILDKSNEHETIAINKEIEAYTRESLEFDRLESIVQLPDEIITLFKDIPYDPKSGTFGQPRTRGGAIPDDIGDSSSPSSLGDAAGASAAGASAADASAAGGDDSAAAADDSAGDYETNNDVLRRKAIVRDMYSVIMRMLYTIREASVKDGRSLDIDSFIRYVSDSRVIDDISETLTEIYPKLDIDTILHWLLDSVTHNRVMYYSELQKIPAGLDMTKEGKEDPDVFEDCGEAFDMLTTPHKKDGSLMEWFANRLTPRKSQKDEFGEVFTPMSLVKEMIDHVPDSFWKDPSKKILDPAAGYGQFPVYAYCKLFDGLAETIPDPKERRDHIIKNMLYIIEIQPKSARILRKMFGGDANIFRGSFIPGEQYSRKRIPIYTDTTFDVGMFDLIMGNPPFNSGGIRSASRKQQKTSNTEKVKSIWLEFIQVSLSLLKKHGYLSFINPLSMFKPIGIYSAIYTHMRNNMSFQYIHPFSTEDSKKLFSGSGEISTVAYVIANTMPASLRDRNKIKIMESTPESTYTIQYTPTLILPHHNEIINKLYHKFNIVDRDTFKNSSSKIQTKGHFKIITKFIDDRGKRLVYYRYSSSKIPEIYYDSKKIILSDAAATSIRYFYDTDGTYGASDPHLVIIVDKPYIEKYLKYFKTRLCTFMYNHIRFNQKFAEPYLLPDLKDIPTSHITDSYLMNYIGLTKKEKEAVMSFKYHPIEYTPEHLQEDTRQSGKSRNTRRNHRPRKQSGNTRR